MCLLHKHLDWGKFVLDQVANPEEYFLALETCEDCLQEYTWQLLAVLQETSPNFTDLTMEKIALEGAKGKRAMTLGKLKPFLHYLIAASLTLFLFNLNFFGRLVQIFPLDITRFELGSQLLDRLGELFGSITIFLGG